MNTKQFLKDIWTRWYDESPKLKEIKGQIDFAKLKEDVNKKKAGEYITNEATGEKYVSIALPEMEGNSLAEVGKYVQKKHRDRLAGFQAWERLYTAGSLDRDNTHFLFGSLLCDAIGDWVVPVLRWGDARGKRGAHSLSSTWLPFCRIVLVEIPDSDPLILRIKSLEDKMSKLEQVIKI